MTINIDHLTESQLIELNQRVIQRLKFLDSVRHHKEMMKFNIGDKVWFQPPGREPMTGTLIKYNQKSVSVIADNGQRWTISPQLLNKAKPSKSIAKQSSNVIDIKKGK